MATPIGERLRQRRVAKGMSQIKLAKLAGMGQSTLSEIEGGLSKKSNAENLMKLAAILETNPNWLLTGKGDPDIATFHPDDSDVAHLANNLTEAKKAAWIAMGLALLEIN